MAKRKSETPRVKSLNKIETRRGKSPKAETYVDEKDGYASDRDDFSFWPITTFRGDVSIWSLMERSGR